MKLIPAYAALISSYLDIILYICIHSTRHLVFAHRHSTKPSLQTAVLIKEYGTGGFVYVVGVLQMISFSHYLFATFIKALTIKSWANTKTIPRFFKSTKQKRLWHRPHNVKVLCTQIHCCNVSI